MKKICGFHGSFCHINNNTTERMATTRELYSFVLDYSTVVLVIVALASDITWNLEHLELNLYFLISIKIQINFKSLPSLIIRSDNCFLVNLSTGQRA